MVGRSESVMIGDDDSASRDRHMGLEEAETDATSVLWGAWNATQMYYPSDACVPQLVDRQAAATPDAVAVVAGNEAITYRELDTRANQLAHYLLTCGVGPEIRVGLCLDRSIDMVVGALGILKSGAAYVPLDPEYPHERLAFLLQDAQVPVLITRHSLLHRLPDGPWHTVALDTDMALLARQRPDAPAAVAAASHLAYVIYTSGSTGQPKGVQVLHNSLLNLVYWHQRAFAVSPLDRATQLASPSFDAAVWELWPYLTVGASIHVLDDFARVSPEALRDWLVEHGITICFLPTALAERIIMLDWPSPSSLRILLTGADTLHRYPSPALPFALVNNYGPTECTVVATSCHVSSNENPSEPPPLGRPIANTQIYVLDEHHCPLPHGEVGELYIGGAGLARGYLNRPELTSEKFIPNPFSQTPGARLYKTGDIGYFRSDGQIAFVGRSDDQIKIRGYRIEPGEIVAALNRHPAVAASAVIAYEESPGHKCLVAYIVPATGTQPDIQALHAFLAMQVPEYMVPVTFEFLDQLPLTANGKVDRAALPVPLRHVTAKTSATAVTPLEERLATIVATLLEVEQVGIDDNIFLLGGHSLLAAQIIIEVRALFGVELSLHTLFSTPTVAQIAAEIERLIVSRVEAMSDDEIRSLLH